MIKIIKQTMINNLLNKINTWSEYSNKIYGYTKQDAETFLKRLQVGIYDAILKNIYWFKNTPTVDTLLLIELDKRKINSYTNITEENYIVYSIAHEIKEHLNYIYDWNKAYNSYYQTKKNLHIQKPLSKKEYINFLEQYENILKRNFTWKEARAITNSFNDINIYENNNLSQTIFNIEKMFSPVIDNYYKTSVENVKYSTNILTLNRITNDLLNKLTENNIESFLEKKKTSIYEEYIRQILTNTEVKNIDQVKYLLNTLLAPKKIIDLDKYIKTSNLNRIKKHYSYIFNYTTELEYLEESVEILIELSANESLYNLTIINNLILLSYGIIPIPLTKEMFALNKKELTKTIMVKTILQSKNFLNKN